VHCARTLFSWSVVVQIPVLVSTAVAGVVVGGVGGPVVGATLDGDTDAVGAPELGDTLDGALLVGIELLLGETDGLLERKRDGQAVGAVESVEAGL